MSRSLCAAGSFLFPEGEPPVPLALPPSMFNGSPAPSDVLGFGSAAAAWPAFPAGVESLDFTWQGQTCIRLCMMCAYVRTCVCVLQTCIPDRTLEFARWGGAMP